MAEGLLPGLSVLSISLHLCSDALGLQSQILLSRQPTTCTYTSNHADHVHLPSITATQASKLDAIVTGWHTQGYVAVSKEGSNQSHPAMAVG